MDLSADINHVRPAACVAAAVGGSAGDLREVLYADANSFIAAVGPKPFMGGDKPNLADLAMFGVLSAIKGTDTYNDLVLNSNIGQWLSRMALTVGDSAEIKHE